jgi:hypothetical protein
MTSRAHITQAVATWLHQNGDKYLITGTDCRGRRFRQTHTNPWVANSINLWRGNLWHLPADPAAAGYKRKRLKQVWN